MSEDHELLRFSTAGAVDDGKSTLIGRLLFDSKSIFEDQLAAIETSTQRRGHDGVDLALLTDGLTAEREQGITIDVAYRYFSTPKRKFIIADTPGHEQYTRNMVTGASTADLALILIDARKGVLHQSRRHAYIAHLLRIRHVVVCVNKMDLVDYAEDVFEKIRTEFLVFAKDLTLGDLCFIPISALNGDNVVTKSPDMPWYKDPTLLSLLETADVTPPTTSSELRFPVQYVNRPNASFRGYCGQVSGGVAKSGQEVLIFPTQKKTYIKTVHTFDGERTVAQYPQSVTLMLTDEIDISRGDVIVAAENVPQVTNVIRADVCWMTEEPLSVRKKYLIKNGCKTVKAVVNAIHHRIDIDTLTKVQASELKLNDIGEIEIKTMTPLVVDSYHQNKITGSFILIDETTNNTVGAGMIL